MGCSPVLAIGALHGVRGLLARGGQNVSEKWQCREANRPTGIGTRAVAIGIDGADRRIVDAIAACVPSA